MTGVLATTGGQIIEIGGAAIAVSGGVSGGGLTALVLTDFVTTYAPARFVVQRYRRTSYGNVPVFFTFTGTAPASVQAQVINNVGTVIQGWTTLTGLTITGQTGTGTLPGVPLGDYYLLQIRDGTTQPTSGPLFSAGATLWGVGIRVAAMGQSNMVQTLQGEYFDTVPGSSLDEIDYWEANTPGSYFDTNGTHGCAINGSARGPGGQSDASLYGNTNVFLRLLQKQLTAEYGRQIPISFTAWAWNATSIQSFVPGGNHYNDLFLSSGQTFSYSANGTFGFSSPTYAGGGDFEMVMWHQGEADQANSVAQRMTDLQTLYQGWLSFVAPFGRTGNDLLFGLAILGNYDPSGVCCPDIENIRIAAAQFVAGANAGTLPGQTAAWSGPRLAWSCLDLFRGSGTVGVNPPTDGLHFSSPPMQKRSARRMMQSAMAWTGAASFDGCGPHLPGTYTRSGPVVTLDATLTGGHTLAPPTSAAGGSFTGFYANTAADFSGTYIPVTATTASSGTKIAVTFPAGTTFPCYLKYQGGKIGDQTEDANGYVPSCYPDIRNPVYDTAVYPTGATGTDVEPFGLPLQPTFAAILVS